MDQALVMVKILVKDQLVIKQVLVMDILVSGLVEKPARGPVVDGRPVGLLVRDLLVFILV
jgi:hypothetical protein